MFRCYYCITYGAGKTSSPIVGPVAGRPAASSPRLGPRSSLQLKRLGEYCTPQRTIPSVCYATVQQLGLVQKGWGGVTFSKKELEGVREFWPPKKNTREFSSTVCNLPRTLLYNNTVQWPNQLGPGAGGVSCSCAPSPKKCDLPPDTR